MGDDAALALGATVQPLRRSIPYPLCARSPGAAQSLSPSSQLLVSTNPQITFPRC